MSSDYERHLDNDNSAFEPQEHEAQTSDPGLSRLSASPEEESNLRRLRLVDRLLSSASMLAPGSDFAEKVVAALRRDFQSFNNNAGLGIIIGLFIITGLVSAIALTGLAGLVNIVLNWTAIYQWLISVGGGLGTLEEAVRQGLDGRLMDSPVVIALAIASLPLTAVWVWLARRLVWVEKSV